MRRSELNYSAGVLCLAVCLLHVLSVGVTELDHRSWQYALVFWPWKLCGCVVPAFLMLGGLKVGLNPPKDYLGYLKRRCRRVVLPYLLAFAVYYIIYVFVGLRVFSVKSALISLLLGSLSFQFYYVILTLQFYLLLPLWRRLLDRFPLWAVLPCALLLSMFWRNMPDLLKRYGIVFPYNDRLFPTCLVFWVVGLYLGKYYERLSEELRRSEILWCTGLTALLSAGITYYAARGNIYLSTNETIQAMGHISACLWLLGMTLRLAERGPAWLQKALAWVGAGSYQIYLWHALFLTLLTRFLPPLPVSQQLLLRGLVTFGGGLGIWALQRLPLFRRKRP